jgi:hypothetical protein
VVSEIVTPAGFHYLPLDCVYSTVGFYSQRCKLSYRTTDIGIPR